jgi:hypothetical protein
MIFAISVILLLLYSFYLYRTREIISDADGAPYLIRFFLKRFKSVGRFCLHHIMKSDHDRALHDHPWPFKSLILWGGYYEIVDEDMIDPFERSTWQKHCDGQLIKWFGPLSLLRRPAFWTHRLLLKENQTTWTLVFMGKKEREWGFWITPSNFCHNSRYNTKTGLCNVDT